MHGLKSVILASFQEGLGWLCPVSAALKNSSQEIKKSFCFGCQLIPRQTGRQNFKGTIFLRFNLVKYVIVLISIPGDILQLVIVELIYKVCLANPNERSRFIRCIYNLLNSSSASVRYEVNQLFFHKKTLFVFFN